jgi:hypothetical protein
MAEKALQIEVGKRCSGEADDTTHSRSPWRAYPNVSDCMQKNSKLMLLKGSHPQEHCPHFKNIFFFLSIFK